MSGSLPPPGGPATTTRPPASAWRRSLRACASSVPFSCPPAAQKPTSGRATFQGADQPAAWDLAQFHLVIQAAFNWWNYHLHEFRIGGLRYGDAEFLDEGSIDGDPRVFDEREVRLRDFRGEDITFAYLYDFGDDWHHTIEIEEMLFLDPAPRHATCIDGARARPPEDVGGIPGYEQFLDVIADPKHPEHQETRRWCGGHFDPEWFDLSVVGKDLRGALKPDAKRRLHQPKPRKADA